MKKFALLIAAVMFSVVAFAEFPLSLGVKLGVNQTRYSVGDLNNLELDGQQYKINDLKSDLANGYDFGVFARLTIKRLYIQPEVYYTLQNSSLDLDAELTSGGIAPKISQQINMQELNVPVLVGFKLLDFKLAKLRAFAGPLVNIPLNRDVTFSKDNNSGIIGKLGEDLTSLKEINWKNELSSPTKYQVGIGLDLLSFYLDVRYEDAFAKGEKLAINPDNYVKFTLGFKIF